MESCGKGIRRNLQDGEKNASVAGGGVKLCTLLKNLTPAGLFLLVGIVGLAGTLLMRILVEVLRRLGVFAEEEFDETV